MKKEILKIFKNRFDRMGFIESSLREINDIFVKDLNINQDGSLLSEYSILSDTKKNKVVDRLEVVSTNSINITITFYNKDGNIEDEIKYRINNDNFYYDELLERIREDKFHKMMKVVKLNGLSMKLANFLDAKKELYHFYKMGIKTYNFANMQSPHLDALGNWVIPETGQANPRLRDILSYYLK